MNDIDTKSLKPGDQIAYTNFRNWGNDPPYVIATVTRVTPSGRVITDRGREFNPDSYERGSSGYHRCRIVAIDDEVRDVIAKFKAINEIEVVTRNLKCLMTTQLVAMAKALQEIIAEGKGESKQS